MEMTVQALRQVFGYRSLYVAADAVAGVAFLIVVRGGDEEEAAVVGDDTEGVYPKE